MVIKKVFIPYENLKKVVISINIFMENKYFSHFYNNYSIYIHNII
jgi:hypothetical protein